MAATLLSQHSSNPLELTDSPSTRKRNRVQLYLEAEARHTASSDDPLNGLLMPELQKYHNHLSQIIPDFPLSRTNRPPPRKAFVDLDEDMESEDELATAMQEQDEDEDVNSEYDEDEDMRDSDAEGETDEEMTIYLKSPEERHEIEEEIADLEIAVPQLQGDYKIVDRLGTGTFSSVYKAIDIGYHDKWDNSPWQGHHPTASSAYYLSAPKPKDTKVFVAIKRIYVTSNPERIRNEISIMEDCRGSRHTSQLITAFRHFDQVVAIMPYHRNEDFREFFRTLSLEGIKAYFRCMFRALRDIHARAIIHRDVKPANFLFDPRTGVGTLCDFGLACRMEPGPSHGQCLHTFPTREHPHGRVRPRSDYNIEDVKRMQREARAKSSMLPEKVGYPEKDPRPVSKANRAGTRGFRAPEVLLKCGEQTGAIDVWAAGVILLSFLTQKFPLLQSNDDIEALMEIAAIIGRRKMEKAATLHSRTFATNVPTVTQEGIPWRTFIEKQNPTIYEPWKPDPQYWPHNQLTHNRYPLKKPERLSPSDHRREIEHAFNLVERLMHPESVYRITPREALYHPFLAEPAGEDDDDALIEDDEFVPHPFGQGACGEMHFHDEVTGGPCVRVSHIGYLALRI
ncbi:hypothetical protein AX16_007393 [Volvariella volvacea WC 439]|nr:hypothetical protein AX16_007393 [Volvariella volvacea WC 439]